MFKVLLADEESIENEALKVIIEEKIKNILIVGTTSIGDNVIKMDQEFHPELIFLGVMMQGTPGLDIAEKLKKENKNQIIIMISSSDKFEFIQRALRLKVEDYLLKPIRPDEVIQLLEYYIDYDRKCKMEQQKNAIAESFHNCNYAYMNDLLQKVSSILEELSLEEASSFVEDILKEMNQKKLETEGEESIQIEQPWLNCKDQKELHQVLLRSAEYFIQGMPYKIKSSVQGNSLKFALNYIEKNFKNNIMLQDVANELNFSNAYLSKRFKKDLGTNFNKYLTQRRIDEAKRMLIQTKMSINDIAFDIGYNEPNYFCKVFKKNEGITPTEYREKNKIFLN